MTTTAAEIIPGQLVPLAEGRILLVPNTVVAEIISMGPYVPAEDGVDWHLGTYNWRGVDIPLVSFEAMSGGRVPELTPLTKIVVFNSLLDSADLKFFGMMSQGIPSLKQIDSSEVQEADSADDPVFVQTAAVVDGVTVLIPDVAAIAGQLLDLK